MTKPVAAHTVSLTIGALYLLLMLGAPFCVLSDPMDYHNGHRMDRSDSVCGWAHSSCDSTLPPSHEFRATLLPSTANLSITVQELSLEIDLQSHPGRSPPVFLS